MYVNGGKITFGRYIVQKTGYLVQEYERPAENSSFETIMSPYIRLKLVFYDIL